MKLTLLTTAAVLATLASAKTNEQKCAKKNGNIIKAISEFCSNTDIVVPSTYAFEGKFVGHGGPKEVNLYIDGTCSPKQWVPQSYCYSQFYDMCANGGEHGENQNVKYGRDGCQSWSLYVHGNGGGAAALSGD